MVTPYQTAARASRAAFYSAAGETVTYRRGAQEVDVSALRTDTGPEVAEVEGVHTRAAGVAFYVAFADLAFGSNEIEPARGDVIEDADGRVYDVQDDWEPLYESQEWRVPVQEVRT